METLNKKEFLQNNPLQYSLPKKEADALEKILKKANESYVLDYKRGLGVKAGRLQYYDFSICCPRTNFGSAYAHIGMLYGQHVLPIWKKRYKQK